MSSLPAANLPGTLTGSGYFGDVQPGIYQQPLVGSSITDTGNQFPLGGPFQAPQANTLFTQDHISSAYGEWWIDKTFAWFNGILAVPLAAPVPAGTTANVPGAFANRVAAKMVRLHAPYGLLAVEWLAVREGDIPFLPNPESQDPNAFLISAHFGSLAPALAPDGFTHAYGISGVYYYWLSQPVWATDGWTMGATAYDSTNINANALPSGQFIQGLF